MKRPYLISTLLLPLFFSVPSMAAAATYHVSPSGDDASDASLERPLKTIQEAVHRAMPGDTVLLGPGEYFQDVVSRRAGHAASPITITGPSDAVVRGAGAARVIEINHSFIVLSGFTVDGLAGPSTKSSSYRDKLIYVLGTEAGVGIAGVQITGMTIKNAGGECVRLRYYVHDSEVSRNTIGPCGVHDFRFNAGGKNGEGIYVGTASDQWGDGKNPESGPDKTTRVLIHHNTFDTQGNECVDIKEGATGNIVEHNVCSGQKDPESGGFDSRGDGNVFRYNSVTGSVGAGVRLGGWLVNGTQYGKHNDVYENIIQGNKAGGIRFQVSPQGKVCGNTFFIGNGAAISVGTYAPLFNPATPCDGGAPPTTPPTGGGPPSSGGIGTTPSPAPHPESLAKTGTLRAHSSNFSDGYGPEKLWDGCYEGASYDSNICTTGGRDTPSFWVEFDLAQPYVLARARLYGDADGDWVSETWSVRHKMDAGAPWEAVFANSSARENGWMEKTFTITARYLRLEVVGDAAGKTQAREFEFFGTPAVSSPTPSGGSSGGAVVNQPPPSGGGGGGGGGGGSPGVIATPPSGLDLRARIAELMQQVAVLQARLSKGGSACSFTRHLALGARGEDVRCLQQFLNRNGFTIASTGPGSSGSETTYFGSLTQQAVRMWQNRYAAQVLAPSGLTSGTGYWGSSSIAYYTTVTP
jgi:hypothetical protein